MGNYERIFDQARRRMDLLEASSTLQNIPYAALSMPRLVYHEGVIVCFRGGSGC